jgi:predicted RNase H-like HicB family nuclease
LLAGNIRAALMQAEYDTLEDGSFVATVPGLQGVIAVGDTLEECRLGITEGLQIKTNVMEIAE